MFNPLMLKLGASALAVVAAFGLGWKVCSWRNDSEYKAVIATLQKEYEAAVAKNKILSDSLTALQIKNQKRIGELNAQLQEELKKSPIYISCTVPDSGVQLFQSSVSSANKVRPTK